MSKKRLFFKTILTMIILVSAFIRYGATAKAGDFDAAFYAATYPDVVAVYGTDPAALYSHYLTYGIKENRFKNAQEAASGVIDNSSIGLPGGAAFQNTYVDVDIANQILVYYQQGIPVLATEVVTGNVKAGNSTPTGVFYIDTKVPGKYLVGPTWKSWVDRWMKFTGAVGLHDASWRKEFGGTIYQTNGSHGCVNLPHDVALKLYDMVDIGTMVVVH